MIPLLVRHGVVTAKEWGDIQRSYDEGGAKAFGALAREMCQDNMQLFCWLAMGLDPMPHFMPVEKAARKYRRMLICASRGSAKSRRWIIAQIVHDLCYGTLAQHRDEVPKILLIQENEDQAKRSLREVKMVMETGGPNGVLLAMFPELWQNIDKFGETEVFLKTRWPSKEPNVLAVGIGGAVTGLHPSSILMDDPTSQKNSRTAAARRLHIEWLGRTIMPMLMEGGRVLAAYTPYSKGDMMNHIEETDDSFHKVRLPALSRTPNKEDYVINYDESGVRVGVTMTEKGLNIQSLWPCPLGTGRCPRTRDHFREYGFHTSTEYLISEHMLGEPISFPNQYLLQLFDDETARIKPDMLRFWSKDSAKVGKPATIYNESIIAPFPALAEVDASVHGWDHAIGQKRHHDKTALARAYRTKDNKVFYANKAGRWGFMEAVKLMESQYETDPIRKPFCIATEGVGFQMAYEEALGANSRSLLPVESIKTHLDKDTCLVESGLLSAMVSGNVYVEFEDEESINELLSFTPEQRYPDDLVDAMRIAYSVIRRRVHRTAGILRR